MQGGEVVRIATKQNISAQTDRQTYDVIVVGSGAAGLTAAIAAAAEGLQVLVVEKAAVWGGTSALSGGGVWVPGNSLMPDRDREAPSYLDIAATDDNTPRWAQRKAAFLEQGPRMIDFLRGLGVKFLRDRRGPDYRMDLPGSRVGRMLECETVDANRLGPWRNSIRPDGYPVAFRVSECAAMTLGPKTLPGLRMLSRIMARMMVGKLRGQQVVGTGRALVAQLMMAAQKLGVTVWLETPLQEVIFDGRRAVGVRVERNGAEIELEATRGVVLAAGGFAHAPEFRQAQQRLSGEWSVASPDDTGDVIRMASRIGAGLGMLEAAWWIPVAIVPGAGPVCLIGERAHPGAIMVDDQGTRFTNECSSYNEIGKDMRRLGLDKGWLIFDTRNRNRYMFLTLTPGSMPKALIENGFFKRGKTIEDLARACDLDPAALQATVSRFNGFCAQGADGDFHRGETLYERYWGDPSVRPNPNLGALSEAPFYAMRFYLGDLGTKGGLLTDEHARVLGQDGQPFDGLYASGNSTASVMGSGGYPGPGSTLGPAMTFGYIAAKHLAARSLNTKAAA